MARVTRKGKVKHITLDPNDNMAQAVASMGTSVDDMYNMGLYMGYEEIKVEYDQDHEESYIHPKGRDMGSSRYWVGRSPLSSGLLHGMQDALIGDLKDLKH